MMTDFLLWAAFSLCFVSSIISFGIILLRQINYKYFSNNKKNSVEQMKEILLQFRTFKNKLSKRSSNVLSIFRVLALS